MRGKHARPSPAAEAARKAAPALAVAGMVLTAQQHPLPAKITPPTTPDVPGARHPGIIPAGTRTGPGLAYLALERLAAPPKATTHGATTYTVQPGDCLWSIAEKFYADGDYMRIFDANRHIIQTPGLILAGQQLVIPGASAPSPVRASPVPASPAPTQPSVSPAPDVVQGSPWSIFSQPDGQKQAVGFADTLLRKISAPDSPGNVQVIYDWEVSEGSGGRNNPLNGGDFGNLASSGTQYGGGANDYPSLSINVTAMAGILENDTGFGYGAIVSALRANDPSAARQAIWDSDWAASHYGYGASFSDAPTPV